MSPSATHSIGKPHNGPHEHKRAEIRIEVDAGAVFTLAKRSLPLGLRPPRLPFRPLTLGYGKVRNISAGGVEISDPQPKIQVGTKVKVGIVSPGIRLGPLQAEVVRETHVGIALRFLGIDPATRSEILTELGRL